MWGAREGAQEEKQMEGSQVRAIVQQGVQAVQRQPVNAITAALRPASALALLASVAT